MTINIFALIFITALSTFAIFHIVRRNRHTELLKKVGYKATGKLVDLKRYQEKRGSRTSYYYVGTYEYYCQGDKYKLRDIKYEFIGKSGDVENELGREVEITYIGYKPKISRTSYQLTEPNTLKFEIIFILIVFIPLLIGVILSIIHPQTL